MLLIRYEAGERWEDVNVLVWERCYWNEWLAEPLKYGSSSASNTALHTLVTISYFRQSWLCQTKKGRYFQMDSRVLTENVVNIKFSKRKKNNRSRLYSKQGYSENL